MHNRQFSPSHSKARTMRISGAVIVLALVFSIPVTRNAVRSSIHGVGMAIARSTGAVGTWFGSIGTAIRFKSSLEAENTDLKNKISALASQNAMQSELSSENADLKATLGRSEHNTFTLAVVLEKPPHSMYDTIIIDGGSKVGFAVGQSVYTNGETPIGTITDVYPNSALVKLFSTSGEKTEARLSPSNIDVTLVGQGSGNFSATVPHDLPIANDIVAVTKELNAHVIAQYQKVTSDPRDPFQTLLLSAPVNMNELNFVEVKKN